uniref:Uncharacterized protein n=1 Tax=Mycena chlorophos TaxID=658473 RepID=A0ABQ0LLT3_MYCCL|nr:predicted protein [Mycena chlorophos]
MECRAQALACRLVALQRSGLRLGSQTHRRAAATLSEAAWGMRRELCVNQGQRKDPIELGACKAFTDGRTVRAAQLRLTQWLRLAPIPTWHRPHSPFCARRKLADSPRSQDALPLLPARGFGVSHPGLRALRIWVGIHPLRQYCRHASIRHMDVFSTIKEISSTHWQEVQTDHRPSLVPPNTQLVGPTPLATSRVGHARFACADKTSPLPNILATAPPPFVGESSRIRPKSQSLENVPTTFQGGRTPFEYGVATFRTRSNPTTDVEEDPMAISQLILLRWLWRLVHGLCTSTTIGYPPRATSVRRLWSYPTGGPTLPDVVFPARRSSEGCGGVTYACNGLGAADHGQVIHLWSFAGLATTTNPAQPCLLPHAQGPRELSLSQIRRVCQHCDGENTSLKDRSSGTVLASVGGLTVMLRRHLGVLSSKLTSRYLVLRFIPAIFLLITFSTALLVIYRVARGPYPNPIPFCPSTRTVTLHPVTYRFILLIPSPLLSLADSLHSLHPSRNNLISPTNGQYTYIPVFFGYFTLAVYDLCAFHGQWRLPTYLRARRHLLRASTLCGGWRRLPRSTTTTSPDTRMQAACLGIGHMSRGWVIAPVGVCAWGRARDGRSPSL